MDPTYPASLWRRRTRIRYVLPLCLVILLVVALAVLANSRATSHTPGHTSGRPFAPPSRNLPAGSVGTTSGDAWSVYHHDGLGSGNDTSGTNLSSVSAAWTTAPLDGELYGEPLEATGRVFAATEADTVYAIAANSGTVLWSTTLGTPVPNHDLPCGDIAPTVGITSTPVIDLGLGEIFVVADTLVNGAPVHILAGLNIYTGATILRQNVDPPGAITKAILQRASLTLDAGRVVFGYGGNDGDCTTYNGWVASVPESGGSMTTFEVDNTAPGQDRGAVWMGGAAPIIDSSGNVWVSSGNGSVSTSKQTFDDGNSVLELSPSMQLIQYFAPATWASYNASDADLGSTSPVLLPNGTVFQSGKTHHAYLLDQATLGGIGHQAATASNFCGGDVDGGNAISGTIVYAPCGTGLEAVRTSASPPSLSTLWQTSTGSKGPAIVASGLVWTIGGSSLFGLNPSTGDAVQTLTIGNEATHFATPSVGAGLLLAPTSDQVHAFKGPSGLPGPPSAAPPAPPKASYWTTAADGGIFSFGNAGFFGSTGNLTLDAPIVGMAPSPTGRYWLVASDGGVFAFGAPFFGSMGGKPLVAPIVGMATGPGGRGYWMVAADGGIFAFGDAAFHGSMGGRPLNQPIVGMAATPSGGGYWLVASDGGIFSFGDAAFDGSMGGRPLNEPIVAISPTAAGAGYWLVASDGGIFSFGNAAFDGSMGGRPLNAPIIGMAATNGAGGYWMVATDGGIFAFGDAKFSGSMGGATLNAPMVAMAVPPNT